jgi:ABC-2 type transport system permease protein
VKKYLAAIKIEWHRQLTYRADFIGFRIGNVIEILVQVVIWTAIFQKTSTVNGYNYQDMMTYIILGWIIYSLAGNYGFEGVIARHIQQGELSNFVTKPINYANFIIALSIGRASIALLSVFVVSILLFSVFSHLLFLSQNPLQWLLVLFMIFVSYFIKLFMSILTGFIAFWTVDISGVFYSVSTFYKFLSGYYFPLNILPAVFVRSCLVLPFAYTFYFPIQVLLGKVSLYRGFLGLLYEIIWLAVLYFVINSVWKRGLRKYESLGI